MIFMAFYRNMVVPTKSEDIAFEEFLKELPADYSEMAHEFFERDGARNFATWSSAVGQLRTAAFRPSVTAVEWIAA
jgi:hypothetical protein